MDTRKRRFLIAAAAAAAAVALTVPRLLNRPRCQPCTTDDLVKLLRPLVGSMVDEAEIIEFADLYRQAFPKTSIYPGDEAHLLTIFVMSTNYYDPDRAADAPVRLVEIYDPYDGACSNHLARFDL